MLIHKAFPVVESWYYDEAVEARVRQLTVGEILRQNSPDNPSSVDTGVGDGAHESDMTAAVYKANAFGGQQVAKLPGDLAVDRPLSKRRPAKDTQAIHVHRFSPLAPGVSSRYPVGVNRNLSLHLIAGVLAGFALSLLFYLSLGVFTPAGFLGWSILSGLIGGLAGAFWLRSIGGTVGITIFVRVVIFAATSGLFVF